MKFGDGFRLASLLTLISIFVCCGDKDHDDPIEPNGGATTRGEASVDQSHKSPPPSVVVTRIRRRSGGGIFLNLKRMNDKLPKEGKFQHQFKTESAEVKWSKVVVTLSKSGVDILPITHMLTKSDAMVLTGSHKAGSKGLDLTMKSTFKGPYDSVEVSFSLFFDFESVSKPGKHVDTVVSQGFFYKSMPADIK